MFSSQKCLNRHRKSLGVAECGKLPKQIMYGDCMEIAGGLIFGLFLLVVGGELLVRGAVAAAKSLGVSPLLIGLTLVGFGTSTPELVTSITAALGGSPGIAIGNAVGSNIANILLVLGAAAIIYPLSVNPKGFKRDATMVGATALVCLAVVLYGTITAPIGIAFLIALVAYVSYVYISEKNTPDEAGLVIEHIVEDTGSGPKNMFLSVAMAIGGIAITIAGARFFVGGAVELAQTFGVSDTIIGLTVVAIGTSMPELVTSVMAALRKHSDVAYGNIIGSNIFNVLFVLGTTAIIKPIIVPPQIAQLDIWVMLAATCLLIFFARSGFKMVRWEGAAFLVAFAGYTAFLVSIA
jgi:cation:H+ antiporter